MKRILIRGAILVIEAIRRHRCLPVLPGHPGHYLGDEGGILCHLAFDADIGPRAFIVSITHLLFDRRNPLAREIASYQKHRFKRLRRDHGGDAINH
jgi:hypothetical protein